MKFVLASVSAELHDMLSFCHKIATSNRPTLSMLNAIKVLFPNLLLSTNREVSRKYHEPIKQMSILLTFLRVSYVSAFVNVETVYIA